MIRLLFTSSYGPVSAVIRWLTRSRASHVGIQVGPDSVIHADRQGVVSSPLQEFLLNGERKLIHQYELLPELEQLGCAKRLGCHVGDSYDYDGMLWNLVPLLSWRWFKIRLGNPLAGCDEFWCSELAVRALLDFLGPAHLDKVPELKRVRQQTVTPGQLLRIASRSPAFKKVAL